MDPELTKGFQELQAQVIESRAKISNIETCQKLTSYDAKINDSILEGFSKDGDNIEDKYFYQPVGRMYVKQEGKAAQEFLLERKKQYQERLRQYEEVRGICSRRVKESENSLRELVNKKRNESGSEPATNNQQQQETEQTTTGVTSAQSSSENEPPKEKESATKK